MNDPIAGMTEDQIIRECCKIVDIELRRDAYLTGMMIEKLKEWDFHIEWKPREQNWKFFNGLVKGCFFEDKSIQVAFLKAALASGKMEDPRGEGKYFRKDGEMAGPYFHGTDSLEALGWKRVRVTPWEEAK